MNGNDICLLSRMALEWCLNFLLSLLQWLDVQPEVDNSMKAIVPAVLLVASSCATCRPKSVDEFYFISLFIDTKTCRLFNIHVLSEKLPQPISIDPNRQY